MNVLQKTALSLLLTIVLGGVVFAQPVHIPDPNLRATVREALQLPSGVPVTQNDMLNLRSLDARDRGINSLEGLQFATKLLSLNIYRNNIADLSPIANLTTLTGLRIGDNPITDLSLLANLTRITHLSASNCGITDITPLANMPWLIRISLGTNHISDLQPLTNLKRIYKLLLRDNKITDVRPIAGLPKLVHLEIDRNYILDHSPLDHIPFEHFTYDETCEEPPLPLQPRLENRMYPSIFRPWGKIINKPHRSEAENTAEHDLFFHRLMLGHRYVKIDGRWLVRGDPNIATKNYYDLLSLNPNMIFLSEIRMRDANPKYFPADSPYWVRDENGNRIGKTWYIIDFTHPDVQDMIVEQAIAVDKCGLYDGIFFDWWKEVKPVSLGWSGFEAEQHARDNIIQRIRANTRPDFLIMVNTNRRIIPRTGPYINGGFMETGVPRIETGDVLEDSLSKVENSLRWLDENLREPRINGYEGSANFSQPPDSPDNLRSMRVSTTLSLTHSDGYVVFNIGTSHDHYWYDFWDADLGRPVGPKSQLYQEIEGLYIREFTNGWAVYNHSGEAQVITLPEEVQGVASGWLNTEHALPNLDGEMYLRVTPQNPADVNGDGVVNILDLTLVAQAFGKDGLGGDVNGDGVVNVFDLVQVAGALGGGGAAPSAYSLDASIISAADVERWLAGAQGLGVGDTNFQRGIRFLEQLLAALTPKETTLLPNYPNPFNPETWIPYRLAREAEVTITIYDTKGTLVRRLALGNQAAGYYAERGKAAYWDGRNEDEEVVASGIYIYQFRAGDYAASRRMVIVK